MIMLVGFVILSMKSREWYEDSIQSILCSCFPQLDKSRIRPAYQKTKKTNPMGVNVIDAEDTLKDGIRGAKNTDDLIYFWLHFDPLDFLATEVTDTVTTIVPFRLTVSCYGLGSLPMAIRLKAFLRTEGVLNQMLGMNAVMPNEPRVTTFPEDINGEWWERTDVDITLDVLVDDLVGGEDAAKGDGIGEGYSKDTNGEIIVEEVGGGAKRL